MNRLETFHQTFKMLSPQFLINLLIFLSITIQLYAEGWKTEPNTSCSVSQATEERRKQVLVQLLDRKHLTVKELAASMNISGATVRCGT